MNAMPSAAASKVALLYPGDRAARDRSEPAESRFAALFQAFAAVGVAAEPAVYHADFADEVEAQLQRVVIALLQNINAMPDSTILLASANHDQLLDASVWRRFSFRIPCPSGCSHA